MRASLAVVVVVIEITLLVACGDNIRPGRPDGVPIACGNGVVDEGEDCDDDAIKDNVCDATCRFTCGNGTVDRDVGELCDTGIASGPGACPSACDDGLACTDDALSNSGCSAECVHSSITAAADGDGCCPAGADATTDGDCDAICGNGVLEEGELCDAGIVAGAGACPAACDDMVVCTTDVLNAPSNCQAACEFVAITTPANGDGCCPAGANANNDSDCSPSCGNAVLEPSEICDTGIASGPGACPTTCSDGIACTTDTLANMGCQAVCVFPPITMPANGDGCCPPGANANNDNNCAPVCGNGVPEPGEQCDDGDTNNHNACRNNCTPNSGVAAFRFADLDLRDPHVHVAAGTCRDLTDNKQLGYSINDKLESAIRTDGNADGLLDLSPTLVFRTFSQNAETTQVELHFATCTAPTGSTTCTPSSGAVATAAATATNASAGQCLTFMPGTTRPYLPAMTSTSASCFVTDPVAMTIDLNGIVIPLRDAQVAAHYVGYPADVLANGLLRGFVSEADASATIVPASYPLIGGKTLSSLLAGGAGACPSFSDKDTHNGVAGWWVYLNFSGNRATWTE